MCRLVAAIAPTASTVFVLACHAGRAALLYFAAAVVARFWHQHLWLIYLCLAFAALLAAR